MQIVALPIYFETFVRVFNYIFVDFFNDFSLLFDVITILYVYFSTSRATSRDRHRTHAIEFYQRPEESLELIYRRASSFFLILAACCDERRKKGVSNLVELLRVDVGIHKSNDLTLVAPVKSVNQVPTGFQLLLTLFVRRKIANGFCLGSLKRAKPTGREKLSCSHCVFSRRSTQRKRCKEKKEGIMSFASILFTLSSLSLSLPLFFLFLFSFFFSSSQSIPTLTTNTFFISRRC